MIIIIIGKVMKGKYEYPFSFTIPDGLPARYGEKNSSRNWFLIRYYLEARLHRHGVLTFDVTNQSEILMCEQPRQLIKSPYYQPPVTSDVYYWCCCKQGTMTAGVSIDTCDIIKNDKLEVNFVIHNNSSATIKAVEVYILETFQTYAQGHSDGAEDTYYYKKRIEGKNLEGVEKLSSSKEYARITVDVDSLRSDLDSKKNQVILHIEGLR